MNMLPKGYSKVSTNWPQCKFHSQCSINRITQISLSHGYTYITKGEVGSGECGCRADRLSENSSASSKQWRRRIKRPHLSLLSVTVLKFCDQHQLREAKVGFSYIYFLITSHSWGKSGQELQWDPGGRNWSWDHGWMLITHAYAQLPFLQLPGPLAHWWHDPEWVGPSRINHYSRKGPTDFPKDQSNGGKISV